MSKYKEGVHCWYADEDDVLEVEIIPSNKAPVEGFSRVRSIKGAKAFWSADKFLYANRADAVRDVCEDIEQQICENSQHITKLYDKNKELAAKLHTLRASIKEKQHG